MHTISHRMISIVGALLASWILVVSVQAEEFGCSHLPDVDPLPFGLQSEALGLPAGQKLRPATQLVFVREGDSTCTLRVFDASRKSTAILPGLPSCPIVISVDHATHAIFPITSETVQMIPMAPGDAPRAPIVLPDLGRTERGSVPRPIRAGRLDDGALYVLFNSRTEGDDDVFQQFVHRGGAWARTSEILCRKFDDRCVDRTRPKRPPVADFWGDEVAIWHDRQLANPYVARRDTSSTHLGTEECSTTSDLTLEFGEVRSTLRVRTVQGPDSGATLTMGVELDVNGAAPMILSGRQCDAELMGRFLLLRRSWAGTELIDLETGKSVLGRLAQAEWLY